MTQAEHIIGLLGGIQQTARIVNAPPTTVQSWRDSGFIPAKRQQRIRDAAKSAGINIRPEDFFPQAAA